MKIKQLRVVFLLFFTVTIVPLTAGVNLVGSVFREDEKTALINAVIWVEIKGHEPRRQPRLEKMVQRDKEFHPKVLVAPVNTEVFFPNEDSIFHNIFSLNKIKKIDLGNYKGEGNPVIFDQEGIYPIGCSIHPWMSAFIVIVSSPFFAKSTTLGGFTLKDLTVGKHTLHLWSMDLKAMIQKEVNLKDGLNQLNWVVSADNFKKKRVRKPKVRKKSSYDGY